MTKIKICGITREEDAVAAAEAGADFLGFVFAEGSPRRITPERAASIATAVGGEGPKLVGVFRNQAIETVRAIARSVPLDLVQLHGDESDDDVRTAGMPVIRVVRVGTSAPRTDAAPAATWLLFDTHDAEHGGGTGRTFDWSLLETYDRSRPFFLAGGLTPENVRAAIERIRPDAVDVSSGVESAPGVKDHEKIRRLIERVKA